MNASLITPPDTWSTDQIYSISFLTQRIENLLHTHIPMLWIRGEISNLKQQNSGHFYFTLKDDQSQITCVLFRGEALHLSSRLENGQSILCYGQLEIYAPRGQYQWIARHILPDGIGSLETEFQRLKEKCQREGLFEPHRKRPIPAAARHIAILSSLTGAALQDFLQILRRKNWHGEVTIFPCRVQGNDSVQDFLHGLDRAETSQADLIVLARGGGSLEDLWTFNSEALIHRIATCHKPIISAIGHETDFTLADFTADLRAETPSAAAEIIATHYQNILQRQEFLKQSIIATCQSWFLQQRYRLMRSEQHFESASPIRYIESKRQSLKSLRLQLHEKFLSSLQPKKQYLSDLQKCLDGYDLFRHLRHGFLIAQNSKGSIIKNRHSVAIGDEFTLQFHDGPMHVRRIAALDEFPS
ncbi:MAG: exodeoxyribonuclease VII large subunit [Puniceicoccales bacterium]|jgi:exodeoxyribonuclease VII large subunit|nr:exodeoxyribonuclease VII large subunit [Puniceicoccales bacterium]